MQKKLVEIDLTNLSLIKDLYFEFMDETHTGRPDDFDIAVVNFISNSAGWLVAVSISDIPVGFVEFRKLPRKLRDNMDIIEITSLFVEKKYRHLGLGKDLVDNVLNFAKNTGCYSVVLYSGLELSQAHNFYEKIGFKKSAFYFKKTVV